MADYLGDVLDQPRAVAATVDGLVATGVLDRIRALPRGVPLVLTGMGSSFAALYGLHLRLLAAGRAAALIEASELVHYAADGLTPEAVLVVASQSGETVEVARLLDRIGRQTVVGITNHAASTLGRRADLLLPLAAGDEGIVATKTYVATLAAAALLGAALTAASEPRPGAIRAAAEGLRGLLARREELTAALVGALGDRPGQLFLIGRGPSYGSALAGALLLKEASHTAAEPLSGGAFRHGPLEMVSAETSALVFAPAGRTGDLARRLAADIAAYGGRVAVVGPGGATFPAGDVDEWLAPLVEIAAPQLLAAAIARARGHTPGRFQRMGKVTTEE